MVRTPATVMLLGLEWMAVGSALALPALLVPQPDDPFVLFVIQLVVLTIGSVVLSMSVLRYLGDDWYPHLGSFGGRLVTGIVGIVVVTGSIGLITLATSAGLRFQPSTQLLQLLSALDIAWVVAGVAIGLGWAKGRTAALSGALMIGAVCVFSIWRYLDVVGFSADGGWTVDGSRLVSMVIPFDVMAAVLAIGALIWGARRRA